MRRCLERGAETLSQANPSLYRDLALYLQVLRELLPVRIAGYVDDMPLWMAAADLLVTKAGPGTIAEALACGLPLVLSSFVPGQETGNVYYVEENGFGVYCPDPQQIAAVAADWLEPGNTVLPAMRARARDLARPQAALEIAQALSELLTQNVVSRD